MLKTFSYQREKAVDYAIKWAYSRNPKYFNFDEIGGDCTNFVSQCLYQGCGVMNYTPTFGWYYLDIDNRSPSWTGVSYLYQFLISNQGVGPFATEEISLSEVQLGDIIQLSNGVRYYHSLFVTEVVRPITNQIFVSAHSFDARNRPLDSYSYQELRVLQIQGYRNYSNE